MSKKEAVKRILGGITGILLAVTVIIAVLPAVSALELADFPSMFIKDGRVDAKIVVGKSAKSDDVLGAVDIAVVLQQKARNIQPGIAVFDTEVGSITSLNSIIVGGPCINSAAAEIMGYPENCLEGFEQGKGILKLYEFGNGHYALLAAGTTALDTRRVTTVLSNYRDFAMTGKEMLITGLTVQEITVKQK